MADPGTDAKFGATYGDQTTGGVLSFGLANSGNRALGLLDTSSTGLTAFGARFINATAQTLNYMTVRLTGEVWRQSNLPKTLRFYYLIDPTADGGLLHQPHRSGARFERQLPNSSDSHRRSAGGWLLPAEPDQSQCGQPGH